MVSVFSACQPQQLKSVSSEEAFAIASILTFQKKSQKMATKKSGQRTAPIRARSVNKPTPEQEPVALTLKVDSKTYVRLSMLGATQRRTHQDIMREAVEQYLDRAGA